MSDLELNTPEKVTKNELNNVLTAIALKCDLLRSRNADRQLAADLHEIEQLAKQAVKLVRQLAYLFKNSSSVGPSYSGLPALPPMDFGVSPSW
jgi:hypothetical protein